MTSTPELDGYEPHSDRPLRSRRTRLLIQLAAVTGIVLLVGPIIASQVRVATISAGDWCARAVSLVSDGPATPAARYELLGPGGLGWNCYATNVIGGDQYVAYLGIIPGPPNLRQPGTAV